MVRSAGIRRATATESRPSGRTRASFQGAGFGGLRRSRRSQQRCSGGLGAVTSTPGCEAAHRSILLRYLRANARSYPLPDDGDHEWLERARCREFSSMPEEFAFVAPTSSRTSSMGIGWPTGGVRRSAGLLLDDFGRGGAHRDLEWNRPGALDGAVCREQGYSPMGGMSRGANTGASWTTFARP